MMRLLSALLRQHPNDGSRVTRPRRGSGRESRRERECTLSFVPEDGVISFRYAFPKPGWYHMWVQVRQAGRILTGAFTFEDEAART